jgi:U3 small nucleolar RNA-associated protein 20
LKLTAIELQDMVRSKVGGTKFAEVYNRIRQGVIDIQRERKITRTLQHTTNPEAAARRKIQRNVAKKGSRKRKDAVFL